MCTPCPRRLALPLKVLLHHPLSKQVPLHHHYQQKFIHPDLQFHRLTIHQGRYYLLQFQYFFLHQHHLSHHLLYQQELHLISRHSSQLQHLHHPTIHQDQYNLLRVQHLLLHQNHLSHHQAYQQKPHLMSHHMYHLQPLLLQ